VRVRVRVRVRVPAGASHLARLPCLHCVEPIGVELDRGLGVGSGLRVKGRVKGRVVVVWGEG
jgi:hypothetical protein